MPKTNNLKAGADKEHEKAVKIVAKGAGIAFVGLLLGKIFAYLTRVFIARTMGPETYGLLSMGIAITSFLTIFSLFGLNLGLIRFIAYYRGKKNLRKIKGSIFSSLKISLPMSIVFSLVLFLFSEQISIFFSKPGLFSVIQTFSLIPVFSVLMYLSFSILMGFNLIKNKVYVVDIGKNLSTLVFVIIFFFLGFKIFGAILAFVFGFLFSAILGLYYVKKIILPKIKKIKGVYVGKELFLFSWPLLMVAVLLMVLSYTDVLMLGYFDTAANVGIYNAALDICILLAFIKTAFGSIFIPTISNLYSHKNIKEIRKIYKISTRWMFSAVFPLFLLLVLFPDKILNILFGKDFVLGSHSLMILAFGYLIDAFFGINEKTTISIGKTKVNFYLTLLAAISNIILNLILIPIYGMMGAAIAMTTALILYNLLLLLYLHRKIKIQPYDKNYLKPFFASLVSIGTVYLILKFIFKSVNLSLLIIGLLIFLVLYIFLILITRGLIKEDILIMKSIERKTKIRLKWLRKIVKFFN